MAFSAALSQLVCSAWARLRGVRHFDGRALLLPDKYEAIRRVPAMSLLSLVFRNGTRAAETNLSGPHLVRFHVMRLTQSCPALRSGGSDVPRLHGVTIPKSGSDGPQFLRLFWQHRRLRACGAGPVLPLRLLPNPLAVNSSRAQGRDAQPHLITSDFNDGDLNGSSGESGSPRVIVWSRRRVKTSMAALPSV